MFLCAIACAAGEGDATPGGVFHPRPLDRIPPGTLVCDEHRRGLSHLLLFVKGRLAAGDVEAVTDTMRYYASLFNLVYTANVSRPDGGRFELERVAVGFSMRIKEQDVVVTADSADGLGGGLSIVGKTVLAGNEEALRGIVLAASSRTCVVVDAPAVMLVENRHQKMDMRLFVWVSELEGRVGAAAWLLRKTGNALECVGEDFQYLPPGMVEDRVMHVDASRFLLGMPTADTFAMVSLPRGRSFPITARLRAAASIRRFDNDSLRELASSLAEAMAVKAAP